MLRPHVIQVTDEFVHQYSGQGATAEWAAQKDNILLQRGLPLESSFDTPRCDGKTTTDQKVRCPAFAACAPQPCRTRLRPLRTVTEITATNRQPSKKDAFAVSIH
jgi:hypothetical protein